MALAGGYTHAGNFEEGLAAGGATKDDDGIGRRGRPAGLGPSAFDSLTGWALADRVLAMNAEVGRATGHPTRPMGLGPTRPNAVAPGPTRPTGLGPDPWAGSQAAREAEAPGAGS